MALLKTEEFLTANHANHANEEGNKRNGSLILIHPHPVSCLCSRISRISRLKILLQDSPASLRHPTSDLSTSRLARPQNSQRKTASIFIRFNRGLNLQNRVAHRRKAIAAIRFREHFGFDHAGFIGQG